MFARALPAVILNYDAARRWPFAGAFRPAQNDGVWPNDFADKAAVKVVVKDEHLYRLSYQALKAAGFLTRDPRVVERKKYGRAKARRSFQFSKR